MNRLGLVLAAHGSHVEPAVHQHFFKLVDRIAGQGLFDEVSPAFHQGEPAFAAVLDRMTADEITVVPVMTSGGYYSDLVLPRELARNTRYAAVKIRQTIPVGSHPGMVDLVADRAAELAGAMNMTPSDTCLVLVGHGTQRHPGSRGATDHLAESLAQRCLWGQVLAAFLDDQPKIEGVCARAGHPNVLVLPFMINDGPHATRDTPQRIGLAVADGDAPPFIGRVGDRRVICDAAIGTDPRIVELILDLARGEDPALPVRPERRRSN